MNIAGQKFKMEQKPFLAGFSAKCDQEMDDVINKELFPVQSDIATLSSNEMKKQLESPQSSFSSLIDFSETLFQSFIRHAEKLRTSINNATCSMLETSTILMLPEIKLLCGRQLDGVFSDKGFLTQWTKIIHSSATELFPPNVEDASKMVAREVKMLQKLARDFKRVSKIIHTKVTKLNERCEEVSFSCLSRLHPKSMANFVRGRAKTAELLENGKSVNTNYESHYMCLPHLRQDVDSAELFSDHLFLTLSSKHGTLLVKRDMDDPWTAFASLHYPERRAIFLALCQHLHQVLHTSYNIFLHVQEMYIAGYPNSIKVHLKDFLAHLASLAKQEDNYKKTNNAKAVQDDSKKLSVLGKATVVTHVNCVHDAMLRFSKVASEVRLLAKDFNTKLRSTTYQPCRAKSKSKSHEEKTVLENPGVKLVIPFVGFGYHSQPNRPHP